MKVLVCGGRDYDNWSEIEYQLGTIHAETPIKQIIAGGAKGADTLAVLWAKGEHIPVREFFADWKKHGRAAGPIRNRQMLDMGQPDLVVAFKGGKGTANMVSLAHSSGVRVIEADV